MNGEACGECWYGSFNCEKHVPPLDAVSSDFGCSFMLIGELDTKSFGQNLHRQPSEFADPCEALFSLGRGNFWDLPPSQRTMLACFTVLRL